MLTGVRVRRLQQVAGALAEGAAEEAELERDQHGPGAADPGGAPDHGLLLAGAFGGTGAGGVVARPRERAVRPGVPYGSGEFGEGGVVGDEGGDLAGGVPVTHGSAPAS